MSAEGKKKRGTSGQTNAKSKPFRLNGWAPSWQARRAGALQASAAHSSGRKSLVGLEGGVLVERLGLGKMHGSEAIYDRMIYHAEMRIHKHSSSHQEAAE